ncbi:MAG TPA: alpha/beta fold hydrolase [Solirubrobacteraceae bacterium]|nr:alpha/beta fold hydrolase [Solirubrobacteraceae bacterium]
MRTAIAPFHLQVPEEDLADLRRRLARTRWPDEETVRDWSQGIPLAYVRELCEYWRTDYDWRRAEARLNAVGQFRTEIDGLAIHFLRARSPHDGALPLLLTHGWPGSVVEFLRVLGPLVDPPRHGGEPSDAFDVVCPSLPGYGFSGKPAEQGWGTRRIAAAWAELMARLGYSRYGAHGGDWGSIVSMRLAERDPEHLAGIHLTMPVAPAAEFGALGELTESEQAALADYAEHRRSGTGYSKQQSTRPQTLGYALVDSPAGQCAWIVEKFWAWTDCDGHPENAVSRDELLDNVMLYWLPGTGASSARLYWESFGDTDLPPIAVPAGCSIFPKEIFRLPRRVADRRFSDLRHWHELDRGGHFAALEQPEALVEELRTFFRDLR